MRKYQYEKKEKSSVIFYIIAHLSDHISDFLFSQ